MFARCLHRLLVVASYSSVTMSDLEQSVLKETHMGRWVGLRQAGAAKPKARASVLVGIRMLMAVW